MATETLTLGKALNAGLRRAMESDPKVLIMGEDVGKLGGVFRITDGLQKDFGEERVIDTPLAESGIIGTAVGLAIRGYRPVCEIQFDGFVYPAYDQIVSQVAKMHYRSQGKVSLPIVIRIPFGGGIGAVEHHSESPEAYFAHTAGLKVVVLRQPARTRTAMIQQAIASDDPIVFFEPKRRYWEKGEVDVGRPAPSVPAARARGSSGPAPTPRVLAYGPMVRTALDAATAAAEDGRELEVIDLRTLSPLDLAPGVRVGAPHRPLRGRARGARQPGPRRGDRGPDHRGVLLLAGGAGAAGDRLRHPLPGRPGRGGVPARPRPGARRRRPLVRAGERACRGSRSSTCPTWARASPRARSSSGWSRSATSIELNQPIVEVETAKAAVEIPAKWAGEVHAIFHPEGTTVEVGTPIIAIDTDPRRRPTLARPALPSPSAASLAAVEVRRRRAGRAGPDRRSRPGRPHRRPGRLRPADHGGQAPAARAPTASCRPQAPCTGRASAPAAPVARRRRRSGTSAAPARRGGPVLAKPPVRKLARDLGVDLVRV